MMEYNSAISRSELFVRAITKVNLKIVLLSKKSQTKKL